MTLKPVDTAIIMVVGPCIDDTDFKSLEESIAYNAAGMDVSLIIEKTDGTSTTTAITLTTGGTSDWTHKDGGYYEVEITATQNAEEGIAYVRGVCTGVLPFESPRYEIVKANIYDSLVKGTDTLETTNPDIIIPIPNIPNAINLSDSAIVRIGIGITNAIGNLPTTAEITPGTIHIYRKALGSTSWVVIVSGAACAETDGLIYYDEVFDTISGYAAGNVIKIIFAGQKVTVNSIDHDIISSGWTFYTYIREEMRGTDSAATATALTTHDTKLDSVIVDVTAIDVLTEAGGLGDLTSIKTQVDAILSLERESGTPTVTGAETTLYEDAAPTKNKMGVVVKIDMAALQAGDTFVLKEKYKDESGGSYQEIDSVEYTGVQTKPLRIITLTPYRYGAIITMQKTGGTDRIIEWESFVEE